MKEQITEKLTELIKRTDLWMQLSPNEGTACKLFLFYPFGRLKAISVTSHVLNRLEMVGKFQPHQVLITLFVFIYYRINLSSILLLAYYSLIATSVSYNPTCIRQLYGEHIFSLFKYIKQVIQLDVVCVFHYEFLRTLCITLQNFVR